MAVIANNESIVPFLGERLSFVRGLDPLGLQNTSDTTFSFLLPGLNNVTGRIRYYSFYCWLLDAYSKESGSTNPKDQRQFIRRSEFIVALISQYIDGDSSSIPGSNYAGGEVNAKGLTQHNLQEGIYKPDGSTRDTYWNYPSGAFGQYYLGSLRDIGIVAERENHAGIYVRTNKKENQFVSGEELAEAFSLNITASGQGLFLNCVKSGLINEKQIKELLPHFNLTEIPSGSEEQELLKRLLLQKDYPLRIEETPYTLRRQTIKHLLHFLSIYTDEFYDRMFVYNCYDGKGKTENKEDLCLTGWYYYQLNEFWQFACTSILNGTLNYLEQQAGLNWMAIPKLVKDATEKIVSEFKKLKVIKTGDEPVNNILSAIMEKQSEYDFFENTANEEFNVKSANAFLLIFKLYYANQNYLDSLKIYSQENNLAKDGEVVSYFITQFNSHRNKPLSKFVYDFIFSNIIYRHQYVAFRKIGGGSLSTQKFIIEDQHIRYIGNFDAGYTSPRISRLLTFLKDLEIITSDNRITKSGKLMLKNLMTESD